MTTKLMSIFQTFVPQYISKVGVLTEYTHINKPYQRIKIEYYRICNSNQGIIDSIQGNKGSRYMSVCMSVCTALPFVWVLRFSVCYSLLDRLFSNLCL